MLPACYPMTPALPPWWMHGPELPEAIRTGIVAMVKAAERRCNGLAQAPDRSGRKRP